MLIALPFRPPIHSGESFHGFLARLAFANRLRPSELAQMVGISEGSWTLMATRREYAPEIAVLTGLEEREVRFRQIIQSSDHPHCLIVSGEIVDARQFDLIFMRSPLGVQPFHKEIWMSKSAQVDPDDGQIILDRGDDGRRRLWAGMCGQFSDFDVWSHLSTTHQI